MLNIRWRGSDRPDQYDKNELKMSTETILWIIYGVNTAIYYYVGRAVISQPRYNLPQLFWNPRVALAAAWLPLFGFLSISVAGFLVTDNGWWFLGACAAAFFVLAVRPRIHE